MQKLINELENKIKTEGIEVVETLYDGFTYCTALKNQKGFYVVYTTKGFRKYREDCLRVLFLSEYIPFGDIEPYVGGDFISPYTKAVFQSRKCIIYYESYFSADDVIELLKS